MRGIKIKKLKGNECSRYSFLGKTELRKCFKSKFWSSLYSLEPSNLSLGINWLLMYSVHCTLKAYKLLYSSFLIFWYKNFPKSWLTLGSLVKTKNLLRNTRISCNRRLSFPKIIEVNFFHKNYKLFIFVCSKYWLKINILEFLSIFDSFFPILLNEPIKNTLY